MTLTLTSMDKYSDIEKKTLAIWYFLIKSGY